jgi:hypothetical protein
MDPIVNGDEYVQYYSPFKTFVNIAFKKEKNENERDGKCQ